MEEQVKQSNLESQGKFVELIKAFPPRSKVELLQLFHGMRPVAEITCIERFKDKIVPAVKALKESGFSVAIDERSERVTLYYISRDQQLADEAVEGGNPRRFGELMGFPKASIDAFVKGEDAVLSYEELDKQIGFENYCVPVRVSKEFTEDERKYLRDTYRILLEDLPETINDFLPHEVDEEEYKKKVAEFVYQ